MITQFPRLRVVPLAIALLLVAMLSATAPAPSALRGQGAVDLRIAGGAPLTWDPARAADATTADVHAQVFETLTAFDVENRTQPALAERWDVSPDGRRIEFTLRPDLRYSDGTPLTGTDVVDSWFRLLDPQRPGPMVSLLTDVSGVPDYLAGRIGREGVGLSADEDSVIVELRRPASYFLAVTGTPSLAVVPPATRDALAQRTLDGPIVVSGAYVPVAQTDASIRLEANPHYWAGVPELDVIEIATDLGGASPVTAFQRGEVDYTAIGRGDASWIRYDARLGPQLRDIANLVVHYYGFDTTASPFDDARVRLAFAKAVDWERIVQLADRQPGRSMVPPGMPGSGDEDFRPAYDPEGARELLADAGFPGGAGFPAVPLVSHGYGFEIAVAGELEAVLGVDVEVEFLAFEDFLNLEPTSGNPRMWNAAWAADYPHPHDFLGLLLETGSASNKGAWSNTEYDALIEQAAATEDPIGQAELYAEAQRLLREEAPVIPVEYSGGYALSRDGLLGAAPSGVGYIRFAGLAWAPGSGR